MQALKLLKRYMKKHLLVFILTIALLVFLNYVRSIIPKMTGVFVSIVKQTPMKDSELPKLFLSFYNESSTIQAKLLTTAILVVLIAFVREITNIFCDVSIYNISEIVGCQAQIDYFKKVQDLPFSYLNHAETGDLIQRSTQDISRFKRFISGSLLELFNSLCKVIIAVFSFASIYFFASIQTYAFLSFPVIICFYFLTYLFYNILFLF